MSATPSNRLEGVVVEDLRPETLKRALLSLEQDWAAKAHAAIREVDPEITFFGVRGSVAELPETEAAIDELRTWLEQPVNGGEVPQAEMSLWDLVNSYQRLAARLYTSDHDAYIDGLSNQALAEKLWHRSQVESAALREPGPMQTATEMLRQLIDVSPQAAKEVQELLQAAQVYAERELQKAAPIYVVRDKLLADDFEEYAVDNGLAVQYLQDAAYVLANWTQLLLLLCNW